MILDYFGPFPNGTFAYHKDLSNDEYFGKAAKGTKTSDPRWMIAKQKFTGVNWIIVYPNGEDSPKFIWDSVESYSYRELGT